MELWVSIEVSMGPKADSLCGSWTKFPVGPGGPLCYEGSQRAVYMLPTLDVLNGENAYFTVKMVESAAFRNRSGPLSG